jgi:hypothetical protein
MVALAVVVVLLWVVAPVALYQIGRFAHGLTQPRRRRIRAPNATAPVAPARAAAPSPTGSSPPKPV